MIGISTDAAPVPQVGASRRCARGSAASLRRECDKNLKLVILKRPWRLFILRSHCEHSPLSSPTAIAMSITWPLFTAWIASPSRTKSELTGLLWLFTGAEEFTSRLATQTINMFDPLDTTDTLWTPSSSSSLSQTDSKICSVNDVKDPCTLHLSVYRTMANTIVSNRGWPR